MNANVTYFPIQYKSDKSTFSPDAENCYTPQISLPLLRKHIDEMSLQGWALVSIQSIPRIEYHDDHAFSVPSGFMLFWQRNPESALNFAPPLATGAVLNDALFAPSSIERGEPPKETAKPASLPPEVFSNSKESLTDLNQKYRIRSTKPAPGRSNEQVDAGVNEQPPTPPNSHNEHAQTIMPGASSRQLPPAAAWEGGGKGAPRPGVASMARSLDDETTDFDPNDPLVHEIAALRRAMLEQTQTQSHTHTTQIVQNKDVIFDKINRE